MTDNNIKQKVTELKTQVAALEQLLATDEQAVLDQADKLDEALASLREAKGQLPDVPEETLLVSLQDVTEQQRAEEALRSSEQKLSLHIQQTPLAYIEWNLEFEVAEWNPAAERIFGYEKEEALGRHAAGLVVPEEIREIVDQVWADLLKQQGGTRSTNENFTKDGRVILCEWYNTPLVDDTGQVIGVASLVQDVTEQQRAAEALRSSEQKLSLHIQQTPLAYIEWDLEFEVAEWNPAAETIFGYEKEEALGRHAAGLIVPESVREIVDQVWADLLKQQGGTRSTNENFTKDGREILCEWYNTPLVDEAGDVIGVVSMVEDITERKQAEEALRESEERTRLIIDSALDAVVTIDAEGRITDWNSQAEIIFDWSREEADGQKLSDTIIPSQYREAHNRGIERFLTTGEGPVLNKRIEIVALHHDGHEFPVELAISPLELGGTFTFSAFIRDITERKRAEEALRSSEQKLSLHIQQTPLAYIEWDLEFEVAEWNPAAERIFGYEKEEALGRHAAGLVVPEEIREIVDQVWADLLKQQGGARSTNENFTKDGRVILCEWYNTPLVDDTGQVIGVASLVQDVTEQQRAAEALRSSEQKLSLHIQQTPLAYIEWNLEFEVAEWNPAAERIFGYEEEEALGRHAAGLVVPESVREIVDQVWADLLKQQGGARSTNENFTKDGREILCEWYNTPLIDENGEVIGVASLVQEVSELQRAIVDYAEYGIISATPEGIITSFNPAAERMLGYTAEELIGKESLAIFHKLEEVVGRAEEFSEELGEPVEPGFDVFTVKARRNLPNQYEWTYVRKDGTEFPILMTVSAIRNEEGEETGFFGLAQDITEQKQTETLLVKRATEMETVAQVSTAASTIMNTEQLLQEVADLTKERFDLYHAHIYLLEEAGEELNLTAGAGEAGRRMVAEGWRIPLEREQSLVARAARDRQSVTINDVQAEPDFLPNPHLPDTRSEMAIPMLVGDRVVGVLDVQADEVGRFTEEDVRIQTTLATQVAVALDNARLLQQTREALADMEATQRRYTAEAWEVYRARRQASSYEEERAGVEPLGDQLPPEASRAVVEKKVVAVSSQSASPTEETKASLMVPLTVRDEVIGVLGLQNITEGRTWTSEEVALVEAISEQVAQVAENLRLFGETREQASREQTIREITERMRTATSLEELVKTTAYELGERLSAGRARVELGLEPETHGPVSDSDQPNNGQSIK